MKKCYYSIITNTFIIDFCVYTIVIKLKNDLFDFNE